VKEREHEPKEREEKERERTPIWRDWLVALSLANLCFLQAWRRVLDPASEFYYYHWKRFPGWAALVAIVLNVLILSALFSIVALLARRSGRASVLRIAQASLLFASLFALNNIRLQFESLLMPNLVKSLTRGGVAVISVLLVALALALVAHYGLRRTTRAVITLLLILSPLAVVNFAHATWLAAKYSNSLEDKPTAPSLAARNADAPRVLWLIFDEFDQRVAFAERPSGLMLPELDRLRRESLFAVNAYPPAGDTLPSLPALITGRLVSGVRQIRQDELEISFQGEEKPVGWSEQPNVFSRARALGYNTALVGWYHPYCRLLSRELTVCSWESGNVITRPERWSVGQNMLNQIRTLLMSVSILQRTRIGRQIDKRIFRKRNLEELKRGRISLQRAIGEKAEGLVNRTDLGLIMLHYPVPHPPGIYERATGAYSFKREQSYLDNLALVDRVLGDLRRALEASGTWDATTVLVSSDHYLRSEVRQTQASQLSQEDLDILTDRAEHRIPFMLKMARQREAMMYESPFNTVLTHDLLLAVLRGELSNAQDASLWLDRHRTIGENFSHIKSP
jgi:hypothetical protein